MKIVPLVALGFLAIAAPSAAREKANDKSLRAADALQMRIIVDEDDKAQQDFMHPNYILNGPANRVMRKDQLVAMLANGQMASDRFDRAIEGTAITGNIGIVMGRETVTPAANSQLGQQFGSKALSRRFTNIFLWEGGKWRFLARQATVAAAP